MLWIRTGSAIGTSSSLTGACARTASGESGRGASGRVGTKPADAPGTITIALQYGHRHAPPAKASSIEIFL